jgi:hypothetical protein
MNIIDIIKGTPFWVWIILGYLVFQGIRATKPSVLSAWQLTIMPLLFIIWSLYSLCSKCAEFNFFLGFWFIAFCVGIFIGYKIMQKVSFKIDAKTKLIHLPGSIIPLCLSMVFFLTKYGLGVTYSLNPIMRGDLYLMSFDLLISGLVAGLSAGRMFIILKSYSAKITYK